MRQREREKSPARELKYNTVVILSSSFSSGNGEKQIGCKNNCHKVMLALL